MAIRELIKKKPQEIVSAQTTRLVTKVWREITDIAIHEAMALTYT